MKGVLKVSKEQVIEIERYCDEHGITRKQRISELGLSHTAYYYTRGLLSEEELHGGHFMPIMSGSGLIQAAIKPVGRSRRKQASVQTKLITIEVRTSSGRFRKFQQPVDLAVGAWYTYKNCSFYLWSNDFFKENPRVAVAVDFTF